MTDIPEVLSSIVLAQADSASASGASAEITSVLDFVIKGGVIMIPIGICSLIAMAVLVERLISLRRSRVIPPGFLAGLKQRLGGSGRDVPEALAYCHQNDSPVAKVFAAGIRKLGEPVEVVERHIQEAGQRQVLKLGKYLRVLSVIAGVSPLLGLLGTIFGMIAAFQTVATTAEALGKTELLAAGIYEAMITTAAGLIVAIPALIFYHWLSARVQKLVMDIDEMVVDFIEELPTGASHRIVEVKQPTSAPADRPRSESLEGARA